MPLGPPLDFINKDDEFFKLEDSEEAKIEKEEHLLSTQLLFV